MGKAWYVHKEGEQHGPFSWDELLEQAEKGSFDGGDMYWSEGMEGWVRGEAVEGLFPKKNITPPPLPQGIPIPPPPPDIPVPPPLPGDPNPPFSQESKAVPPVDRPLPRQTVKSKKKLGGLQIAGIVVGALVLLIVLLVIISLSTVRSTLRSSEVYAQAMEALQSNPEARSLLGEPIEAGKKVNGSIETDNGSGSAEISIPVSGSLSSGTLDVTGTRTSGQWKLTGADLLTENGQSVNILSSRQAGALPAPVSGKNIFSEPGYGFTMQYPEGWTYRIDENSVYFNGPEGTEEGNNMIVVQVLATTSIGGSYSGLQELEGDLEQQYAGLNGTIYERDSGVDMLGDTEHAYAMIGASYPHAGEEIVEVAIMLERDQNYLYLILYSIPVSLSDKYIDLVFDQVIATFDFTEF